MDPEAYENQLKFGKNAPYKSAAGDGDQNNVMRKTLDDLENPVYDKQFYLSGDFPPRVIFMPNDHLMEVMIQKLIDNTNCCIEDLMSKVYGISSICHLCEADIKPQDKADKPGDRRFRWPEDRVAGDCPHVDFHVKCMTEAAKNQEVELDQVVCPICLEHRHHEGDSCGHKSDR